MTSLASNTMSPAKDGTSSLPRRQSFARPPLRALYDLLVAPMEGVSAPGPPGCTIPRSVPTWRFLKTTAFESRLLVRGRSGLRPRLCSPAGKLSPSLRDRTNVLPPQLPKARHRRRRGHRSCRHGHRPRPSAPAGARPHGPPSPVRVWPEQLKPGCAFW